MSKSDPKDGIESKEVLTNTSLEIDWPTEKNVTVKSTETSWDDEWHPDFSI